MLKEDLLIALLKSNPAIQNFCIDDSKIDYSNTEKKTSIILEIIFQEKK